MPLDREELVRRLTATFLEEVGEHVRVLNRELLALEREPDARRAEATQALFRAAHSLKGAARSVNATAIAAVAHKLEELLADVRDGKRALTPELFELLFSVTDALGQGGERFRQGISDDPLLLEHLTRIEAALRTHDSQRAARATDAPPASSRLPASERPSSDAPGAAGGAAQGTSSGASEPASTPGRTSQAASGAGTASPAAGSSVWPADPARTARPPAAPTLPPPPAPSASVPAERTPPDDRGVIRVPRRRLDRLIADSGELRAARLRLDTRRLELERVAELVHRAHTELRRARRVRASETRRRARSLPDETRAHGRLAPPEQTTSGAHASRARATPLATSSRRPARGTASELDAHLERIQQELHRLTAELTADQRAIDRAAEPLESAVLELRMEPFGELEDVLGRVARDAAAAGSKLVGFELEGRATELDRALLESLKSPLSHLIRNAIDHGIEPPLERQQAGKPARGRVAVAVRLRGELAEIEVSDDGRGLDPSAIRQRARAHGISEADSADPARLIFVHGLSTAEQVTEISGRGVGLDVVKTALEAAGGRIDVAYEAGRGTRFVLELPPTLSTARVAYVRVADRIFGLPCAAIERLVRVEPSALRQVDGKPVLLDGAAPRPVLSLARVLGLAGDALEPNARLTLVLLQARGRSVALAVEAVLEQREVLLKPLGRRVRGQRHVSSATLLPDGSVALVLNPSELVAKGLELPDALEGFRTAASTAARSRLLLVDDSVTTRTLERNILEAAGYEVMTAVDGRAALAVLERQGADLVVSDVEMPELDGLGLVAAIRASARFRELPVILLTSLDTAEQRQKGLEAGADAYLVKSAFDQTRLLETIRQLL